MGTRHKFLLLSTAITSIAFSSIILGNTSYASTQYVSTYSYTDGYTAGSTITLANKSIEITQAGTYTLKGTIADGQVVVNVGEDQEVTLILAGVNITSSQSAALYIQSGKATIELQAGTTNTLTDGSTYSNQVDDEPNATIFAEEDLDITGNGTLIVNGNYNDGITTKDDLNITSGTITVKAVDDGIRGKDSIDIDGGTITITSGGDALKSDEETEGTIDIDGGNITIYSGDDGIKAYSVMTINNGMITVAKSVEGLEAEQIILNGGTIAITSSDDGINTTTSDDSSTVSEMMAQAGIMLTINGGTITVNAEGDGLDSNGSIEMNGGSVTVYGPTNGGNGALDYNGTFIISGGKIIAAGSAGMAMNASTSSTQKSILINLSTTVSANTSFVITDTSGNTVLSFTSPKVFQSVMFSSSSLTAGKTYTYSVGGTTTGTFTVSSSGALTQVGTSGGMMGGGNGGMIPPGGSGAMMGSGRMTPPSGTGGFMTGGMVPPTMGSGGTMPQNMGSGTMTPPTMGSGGMIPGNTSSAVLFPEFVGVCNTSSTSLSSTSIMEYYDTLGIVNRTNAESRNLTRAEFLKLVLNAAGIDVSGESAPNYSDVSADNSLAQYIAYATRVGMVSGQNGNFRPNDGITRGEAMKILVNATNLTQSSGATNFTDVPMTYSLASYIQTAQSNCIAQGVTSTTFEPLRGITVAEAVKVLYNISRT